MGCEIIQHNTSFDLCCFMWASRTEGKDTFFATSHLLVCVLQAVRSKRYEQKKIKLLQLKASHSRDSLVQVLPL